MKRLLILLILLAACAKTEVERTPSGLAAAELSTVSKVEVFHFHSTQQCYSCKTVGQYAKETVEAYFPVQVSEGKVEFRSINIDLPENREMTMKYGATGSSLWLGIYDESGFHAEQNVKVWYKLDDKDGFMNYLKEVVDKRLAGDMS